MSKKQFILLILQFGISFYSEKKYRYIFVSLKNNNDIIYHTMKRILFLLAIFLQFSVIAQTTISGI
ncbi:MAG: hypothetical protein ACPGU6_08245, partial [Tenacibaculum sp.]